VFIAALPQFFDLVEDQSRGYRLTTFLFSRLGFVDHRQNLPIHMKTLPLYWEIFSPFFHETRIANICSRQVITYDELFITDT
jgi:hypothetical protein